MQRRRTLVVRYHEQQCQLAVNFSSKCSDVIVWKLEPVAHFVSGAFYPCCLLYLKLRINQIELSLINWKLN
jgi:hypothetical protein